MSLKAMSVFYMEIKRYGVALKENISGHIYYLELSS